MVLQAHEINSSMKYYTNYQGEKNVWTNNNQTKTLKNNLLQEFNDWKYCKQIPNLKSQ